MIFPKPSFAGAVAEAGAGILDINDRSGYGVDLPGPAGAFLAAVPRTSRRWRLFVRADHS